MVSDMQEKEAGLLGRKEEPSKWLGKQWAVV